MIIGDLELVLIELPAGDGAVRTLLVRVVTEAGFEGWGETRARWHPGELAARRKALLAALAGREVHDIESMLAMDVFSEPALACAVEMALWDLVAKAARQPLCHLLGGPYRQSVPLTVRLPAAAPDAMSHWARTLSAQAIGTQTMVTTGCVENDLQWISALDDACSHRVQFRLDVQQRYDRRQAAELCARLEPGTVEFVLDPLQESQLDLLPSLQAGSRVPLGVCVNIRTPADVMHWARVGGPAVVAVDPVRMGGLSRARRAAAVAEAGGIAPVLQVDRTSGLALAATLQIAAATPSLSGAHECSHPKLHDDILVEPLRMVDGMLAVPMSPGLGVQVDRDKVDWYQVDA